MPSSKFMYHIVTEQTWKEIQQLEEYRPPSLVLEGFIHLSYENQVLATAGRFYLSCITLLVLEIDPDMYNGYIKIEKSGEDGYFPHLYGPIHMMDILRVHKISLGANGSFHWS